MPHLPVWPAAGTGAETSADSPPLPPKPALPTSPSLAHFISADVEMGPPSGGASSASSDDLSLCTLAPPPRVCSMGGAGPALGTPPPNAPPATIHDLPTDILRTILGLLEPTASKRALSRVSTSWRLALSSPAAWPAVDLHPVTVASSTWLSRMLAGPGGGRVAVTVRSPADEASCVFFHDLVLAAAPAALAALTIHIPWQTSFHFSHLWWALKHQKVRSLSLRGGSVDVAALPLSPGSSLAHLSIECTSLANLDHLRAGARHLAALELSVWPALGGPASAAAAAAGRHPAPGGRAAVEPALALGGLDPAPLRALTALRSLSLNTHAWAAGPAEALWSGGGLLDLNRLTSLTLAAAPGFSSFLTLPDNCALRLSARGSLPPRCPFYSSLVSLSLRDLSAPTFDASPLTSCSQLAALDVSFAAETGCVTGLAGLTGLTSLKAGCSALRLVLPPLPALRELECVAFGDLEISFERLEGAAPAQNVVAAALAAPRRRDGGLARGSIYLASLSFDVGVIQFVHACGRAGLDLQFATSPLRAVFTADQVDG